MNLLKTEVSGRAVTIQESLVAAGDDMGLLTCRSKG